MATLFRELTMMDIFVDTWNGGFQIVFNITKVNKYFVGISNLWISLPMEYTKLNAQQK